MVRRLLTNVHKNRCLDFKISRSIIRAMAIIRSEDSKENALELVFNNGDLEALESAVKRLGFKDEVSLLRYALAVLSQSATRTLTVIDTNGKSVSLNPSEVLLAQKVPTETK
jgi:hypothetical protein